MTPLRITARNLHDPERGIAPDVWQAQTETGTVLVARTRSPFLDGARALLALGADPGALVVFRISGKEHDGFDPIPLARAAKMAVSERDSRSVRLAAWRPFNKPAQPGTRGAELPPLALSRAASPPARTLALKDQGAAV